MKKLMILASFALVIGIYSFQNSSNEVPESTTEETVVKKQKNRNRKISSINENAMMNSSNNNSNYQYDTGVAASDHDAINCLNYDGDDVCQNDYSQQDSFQEDAFAHTDSEASQIIEEPVMDNLEEINPNEFERDSEGALFAASPAVSEE